MYVLLAIVYVTKLCLADINPDQHRDASLIVLPPIILGYDDLYDKPNEKQPTIDEVKPNTNEENGDDDHDKDRQIENTSNNDHKKHRFKKNTDNYVHDNDRYKDNTDNGRHKDNTGNQNKNRHKEYTDHHNYHQNRLKLCDKTNEVKCKQGQNNDKMTVIGKFYLPKKICQEPCV